MKIRLAMLALNVAYRLLTIAGDMVKEGEAKKVDEPSSTK
jgi:hypothetical protein